MGIERTGKCPLDDSRRRKMGFYQFFRRMEQAINRPDAEHLPARHSRRTLASPKIHRRRLIQDRHGAPMITKIEKLQRKPGQRLYCNCQKASCFPCQNHATIAAQTEDGFIQLCPSCRKEYSTNSGELSSSPAPFGVRP